LTLRYAIVVAVAVAAAGILGYLILSGAVTLVVRADACVPALPCCAYVLPASSPASGSITLACDVSLLVICGDPIVLIRLSMTW